MRARCHSEIKVYTPKTAHIPCERRCTCAPRFSGARLTTLSSSWPYDQNPAREVGHRVGVKPAQRRARDSCVHAHPTPRGGCAKWQADGGSRPRPHADGAFGPPVERASNSVFEGVRPPMEVPPILPGHGSGDAVRGCKCRVGREARVRTDGTGAPIASSRAPTPRTCSWADPAWSAPQACSCEVGPAAEGGA